MQLVFCGSFLSVFYWFKKDEVHYHANFALYINGTRDEFKSFTFYEEVQTCGVEDADNPKSRVHMHGQVNHVAHVHDHAATWGHFFSNLGYSLGNDVIKTDRGTFLDSQDGKRLRFMLNGQSVDTVANRTINSEDVLHISYGDEGDTVLQQQYQAISRDAHEYNQKTDPSSCSGGQPLTLTERFKKALGS